MLNRSVAFVGVFVLVLAAFVGGCGSQKAPAEAAIAAAETAFTAVQAEAVKYLPEQAKGVADAIAGAKAALGKGDYQAALAAAQALPAKISDLSAAVAAKKTELTAAWTSLSGSMPKVVEVIQSRIGILSKSKALPAGLDAAKFDQAKSGLANLTSAWTEATTAFGAGNLTEAVAKAGSAKSLAVTVMNLLNMQVPAALQAEGK
jgi:hypothetical protein